MGSLNSSKILQAIVVLWSILLSGTIVAMQWGIVKGVMAGAILAFVYIVLGCYIRKNRLIPEPPQDG